MKPRNWFAFLNSRFSRHESKEAAVRWVEENAEPGTYATIRHITSDPDIVMLYPLHESE